LRTELQQAPYAQCEAQYALISGKDPRKLTSKEVVMDFLANYQGKLKLPTDQAFIDALVAALEEEKAHRDKFVFYHGVPSLLRVIPSLLRVIPAKAGT
jgi:hypothetical protein